MATPINRRQFLTTSGLALGAAPFHALACRNKNSEQPVSRSVIKNETSHDGYGPLEPVIDQTTGLPLLYLPRNFEYLTFGWTGDPLLDGTPTPGSHDGMGAFSLASDRLLLIRNHELRRGVKFGTTLSMTSMLAVEPQLSNSTQPQAPLARPGPA